MRAKPIKAYANIGWARLSRRLGTESLRSYPFSAYVDPTMFCNLKCPACPTGLKLDVRPRVLLDVSLFKRFIDELGDFLFVLEMYNWGEPLLHKEFPEMIAYAKRRGIYIRSSTNLSLPVDESYLERIVLSGLDLLVIGIDGATQESYSKYRRAGSLDLVRKNLKTLHELKKRHHLEKPELQWRFLVFKHNEHEMEMATRLYREWGADSLEFAAPQLPPDGYGPGIEASTIDSFNIYASTPENVRRWRTGEVFNPYYPGRQLSRPCAWLWGSITLNPGGSISPCCSVVGKKHDFDQDATEKSFRSVWNGSTYRKARAVDSRMAKSYQDEEITEIKPVGMAIGSSLPEGKLICEECPIPNYREGPLSAVHQALKGLFAAFRQGGIGTKLWCLVAYALMGFPRLDKLADYVRRGSAALVRRNPFPPVSAAETISKASQES
jgi:MoaA/NifB/PqqE/SkfB family radical SAM enzyme